MLHTTLYINSCAHLLSRFCTTTQVRVVTYLSKNSPTFGYDMHTLWYKTRKSPLHSEYAYNCNNNALRILLVVIWVSTNVISTKIHIKNTWNHYWFFAYFTGFYGVDKNPVKLVSMRGQQNTCKKLVDWFFIFKYLEHR